MIRALGDDGLLVSCGGGPIRHRIARHLIASGHWAEVVPGKEDVAVIFDPHVLSLARAMEALSEMLERIPEGRGASGLRHEIPVQFGGDAGPDFNRLCAENGLSGDALIALVLEAEYLVDLIGFTPGFAYLAGLPNILKAERLGIPRSRVPAGSIGMITGQAGLYALEGPGGWPLIGRALVPLFDLSSEEPFRLQPGDRVRFVLDAS